MSNGTANGNGWTWPRCIFEAGKTFGVPTVLLLFLCWWLVFYISPPLLNAVTLFVSSTVEQQKSLVETQKAIAESVEEISAAAGEIIKVERESQDFMRVVQEQHNDHKRDLETIKDAVQHESY